MEDKMQPDPPNNTPNQHVSEKNEPVRSRWTPKPEQILILESIFNSGMVNPPKEETIKIRKLLEKFGNVGDANVFYWFQNRRSRSRRRQRQMQQATLDQQKNQMVMMQSQQVANNGASEITNPAMVFGDSSGSSSSSCGGVLGGQQGMDGLFSVSSQMGFFGGYGGASASAITGLITVFINGIATEVQAGPIDMKTVFGEDVMLVHSSGVPVPTNEHGILIHNLHHGESYFLVSKSTQV
ncbi:WUSCHEL-related homeobox 11-like isoform X2 [Vicia villosa]|uniref:WUSCHEL-related homeobox 11-like isoform X2 n=1 Tax=Vicia villosa TaxID=3911 RepID=UPI00273BBA18|nr:WUSCHEL-related homeobox 11-like isoform X2 [Vicia villosa]